MALSYGPKLGLLVDAAEGEAHYEALCRLLRGVDALVQGSAIDNALNAPPSTPADGDVYIVGGTPTGAWSGHARHIARWSAKESLWEFYTPRDGWLFFVASLDGYLSYRTVGGWAEFPPAGPVVVPPGPTWAEAYFEGTLGDPAYAMTHDSSVVGAAVGFPESTGKRYFELVCEPLAAGSTEVEVGFVTESVLAALSSGSAWGGYWFPGGVGGTFTWSSFGVVKKDGGTEGTITGFNDTDIIGFAVDLDAGLVWPMINGAAVTGDPVAGTGGYDISDFGGAVRPFAGSNGTGRAITILAEDGAINYPVAGFTPWYTP